MLSAFPYAIHTVLTDNGMAFADLPKNRGRNSAMEAFFGGHIFDRVCSEHGIQHKLTKPCHPWTNGQAERMNRTVKEATIKAFHYPDQESLKAHVIAFVSAYNFAKHLKALRWRTPFEAVCHAWTTTPEIFKLNPRHLIPGPNIGECLDVASLFKPGVPAEAHAGQDGNLLPAQPWGMAPPISQTYVTRLKTRPSARKESAKRLALLW